MNSLGQSALLNAVKYKHYDLTRMILNEIPQSQSVNAISYFGNHNATVLMASCANNWIDIVFTLLPLISDVNVMRILRLVELPLY